MSNLTKTERAKLEKNFDGLIQRLNAAKPDKKDIESFNKLLKETPDFLDRKFLKSAELLESEISDSYDNFLLAHNIEKRASADAR